MSVRPVHIHIDELVLAGFPASERYRIQDAVQQALEEMIASGAMPLPQRLESLEVDAVAPQAVTLRHGPSPREVGSTVARSVLGGVGSVRASGQGSSR
jgi:hypothetical protein